MRGPGAPGRPGGRPPRLWLGPLVLLAVLVLFPLAEILVAVRLGSEIGGLWVLAVLAATSLLGGWVLTRQVPRRWRDLRAGVDQQRLARGELPGRELADGALVLVGGMLLLLPGLVSDLVGLLCLLPATRPLVRWAFTAWVSRRAVVVSHRLRRPGAVVPGEVVGDDGGPRGAGDDETPGPQGPRVVEGRVLPDDGGRPG